MAKHWGMNVYSQADRKVGNRLQIRFAALSDDVTALSTGLADIMRDARQQMGDKNPRIQPPLTAQ